MSQPLDRRRGVWLAAATLLALPIVGQICIWLLVLPLAMWAGPPLEAAGYLGTPRSHDVAAWTLNLAGLAGGSAICWSVWRRLSTRAGNKRGAPVS